MFLSFNMMNPTFVKASEKREIKSNKNIIIMVDQNSEKRAIIPTQISKTIKMILKRIIFQKNVM